MGWKLELRAEGCGVEFFEKYRLQNVGTTRARLAELITVFENERHALTIRELNDLRDEMDELTEKLRAERDEL
jgi:hypothetical protein